MINALWSIPCQMSIDIFEILKSEKSYFFIVYLKTNIFLYMIQKCPNFRINIWVIIFCKIFVKFFEKREMGEGSDKYENWCVEQLGHVETSPSWRKYLTNFFLPFLSSNGYRARFLLTRFNWSSTYMLNIFITSCLFF